MGERGEGMTYQERKKREEERKQAKYEAWIKTSFDTMSDENRDWLIKFTQRQVARYQDLCAQASTQNQSAITIARLATLKAHITSAVRGIAVRISELNEEFRRLVLLC